MRPVLKLIEEFGSPTPGFRKEAGFRLQRGYLIINATPCQVGEMAYYNVKVVIGEEGGLKFWTII